MVDQFTVGFSAARDISKEDQRNLSRFGIVYLNHIVDYRTTPIQFITGGARGGDEYIGRLLYTMYPTTKMFSHTVIVPANTSQVSSWWLEFDDVNVINMEKGTSYKDRNQKIVNRSDELIGFPLYTEHDSRSLRSGTWQTIRMARKANKRTTVRVLRNDIDY